MIKTKTFIESNPKWQILVEYVSRVESFKDTTPGLVIENCKSLIESIFKTILVEVASESEDSLKELSTANLYGKVKDLLFFEKQGYRNIIGSYSSAITEYRNKFGEVSHGKDIHTLKSNREALFADEITFLLDTTDNIAFFLLSYYTNLFPKFAEVKKKLKYEDCDEFNDWFDDNQEIVAIGGTYLLPSKVLFDGDVEVYKSNLSEYLGKNELIEKLRICPNFASTHSIIADLSHLQDFSKAQIRRLFDVFFFNNQVNWIASDTDVANFYKPLVSENADLLSEEEFNKFNESFDNSL